MNESEILFLKKHSHIPKEISKTFINKNKELRDSIYYLRKNKNNIRYRSLNHIKLFEIGNDLIFKIIILNDTMLYGDIIFKDKSNFLVGSSWRTFLNEILKYYKIENNNFLKYFSIENINNLINEYNNCKYNLDLNLKKDSNSKMIIESKIKNDLLLFEEIIDLSIKMIPSINNINLLKIFNTNIENLILIHNNRRNELLNFIKK